MNDWLKNLNIRNALVGIIAIALLFLSVSTTILNNSMFTSVTAQGIEQNLLPNQLAKVEARIRYQLSTPLELSKGMSQNKYLSDWSLAGEPEAQQQKVIDYLTHVQQKNDALVAFWVSNVSKNYYNQNGILKQLNREEDAWFFEFISSGRTFQIAFDYEENSQQLTAFVNYLAKEQGQTLAIAGLGYSVTEISEEILSNTIGESGFVFVTDTQGNVIIHPELANMTTRKLSNMEGFSRVSTKLLQSSPNYVFDQIEQDGVDYYVASVGIAELDWKILAVLPVSETMSSVNAALTKTAVFNLVLTGAFILLMIFVANRITRPILDISQRMLQMAQQGGDLTQRLDDSRGDELGQLAQGFNAIISKVNEMIIDIKHTEDVMDERFKLLNEMANSVDEFVHAQQSQAHSVATAANEMNFSISEVSNLASTTAERTETTLSQVQESNDHIQQTSSAMNDLHNSNQITQERIAMLAQETETISSVIETINGISEQTNLLALNAAIEAARAGEQGRGFAVVADEVRTLAARTQESTGEIKTVIETLQQSAKEAVTAMEKNTELADLGQEETLTASDALSSVVADITEITNLNTQVASATSEQASVVGELSSNVTSIADMASNISELSVKTKNTVAELNQQNEKLKQLVFQFKTG